MLCKIVTSRGIDMTASRPLRVVKLGGSLLDSPQLAQRLPRWVARQSPAQHVIVVGGGPFADALRILQPRLGLTDVATHWLAIRGMSLSAQHVQTVLEAAGHSWPLVDRIDDRETRRVLLLDAETMLRHATDDRLPENWSVTSDSIAAWVAIRRQAAELVLLKSRLGDPVPPFVDEHFPTLADRLPPCRVVEFRAG